MSISSAKLNVEHSLQNYFVLEKSNSDSLVDSLNKPTLMDDKNPYYDSNECDYDHLGENLRKKVEEDTYHHAFFSSNENESDYGVKDTNDDCLMENLYDHMSANDSQFTMPDSEYNTISSVHNKV